MNTTKKVSFKSGTLTGPAVYDSYKALKSQFGYFHEEKFINRAQKELLEKPQCAISVTIPILNKNGKNKIKNAIVVKHGRVRESFISRIIYDPGLAKESIKAIALSDHLRAMLADIPFEPIPVGIKHREGGLSESIRLQIEKYVKGCLSPFSHHQEPDKSQPIKPLNSCSNRNSRFSNHCLSNILMALKKLKFSGRNKIKVAASKINSLTRKEFEVLPENEFKILPQDKDKAPFNDVLVLSNPEPLSLSDAMNIRAEVIVDLYQGAVDPEVRAILAEKGIDIIPNIITSLPEIIKIYFNSVDNYKLGFSDSDSISTYGCRITAKAFRSAWKLANRESISLTSAAFALAIKKSAKIQSSSCSFRL